MKNQDLEVRIENLEKRFYYLAKIKDQVSNRNWLNGLSLIPYIASTFLFYFSQFETDTPSTAGIAGLGSGLMLFLAGYFTYKINKNSNKKIKEYQRLIEEI